MAFQDTKTLDEADSKAQALGAVAYQDTYVRYQGKQELFSRTYYTEDKWECANYGVDMQSFQTIRREVAPEYLRPWSDGHLTRTILLTMPHLVRGSGYVAF